MGFGRAVILKCFLLKGATSLFPAGWRGTNVGLSLPTVGIHRREWALP